MWELLNSVANPLFLAHTLLRNGNRNVKNGTITLIDMGGVERQGLNVPHVIACDVLKVPCQNGWVEGLEHTVWHMNSRAGDPGLSAQQLDDLEWLFRQRDCAYRDELLLLETPHNNITNNNKNDRWTLTILQKDTLWQDCDPYDDQFQQSLRKNTSHLLYLIQSQVGCSPLGDVNITSLRGMVMEQKQESSRAIWKRRDWLNSRSTGQQTIGLVAKIHTSTTTALIETMASTGDYYSMMAHLKSVAMIQSVLVVFLVVFTLYKLRRTIRCVVLR
jgi:hypothetical protein